MPIDQIKQDWKDGKYKVKRENNLIYKKGEFDFEDESQTVIWNKNKIKEHNNAAGVQIELYDQQDENLLQDLRDDCVDVLHDDYGFSTSEARDVYDCALNILDNKITEYFFNKLIQIAELVDSFNKKIRAAIELQRNR